MDQEGWKTFKLGNLIYHKKGFAFKSSLYRESGTPIIRVSNFNNNSIDMTHCLYIDENQNENYKAVQLSTNDIVIATVGSWPNNPASVVGRVIKVPAKANGALLNQNAVILKSREGLHNIFLYYKLKGNDFTNYLVSGAQGSANQASITLEQIFNYKITIPGLLIQYKIASILSSLDEKIELNLQMNKTLEAIAQEIFKEWFVDFRFPGFDGELVDGLPKGWSRRKLGDVISFIKGRKPKDTSDAKKENYLPQLLIDTFNSGNYVFADTNNMVIANDRDMVMVMDGASSGRIEIGFSGVVGSTLAKINVSTEFNHPLFIFHFLKTKVLDITGNPTGSSIPHADKSKIFGYIINLPSDQDLQKFEEIANYINDHIILIKKENQTLTHLRNILLPKLMSGKIRVL